MTITYSIISGSLPSGLSLSSTGTIYGTPDPVISLTRSRFVIREQDGTTITDKTFYIDINGPTPPTWLTSRSYLNVGQRGESWALNYQNVNYQLQAQAQILPSSYKLHYYIKDGDGHLPPGLSLSDDGVISGFIKDVLAFKGTANSTAGYDEETYDTFSYDHDPSTLIQTAKIYPFTVTASDGVSQSTTSTKILVVSPDLIRSTSTNWFGLPQYQITTNTNYIPPLQFINGTNLGVVRAATNQILDVSAYDPYPLFGNTTYTISSGTDILTQLPEGLSLDNVNGFLHGFIPYQPAYTRNYTLTVNAIKSLGTYSVTTTNVFSLAVEGQVESSIEWVTTSSLGTIITGITSELSVVAKQINSNYDIKYNLTGGQLPPGLTLDQGGDLVGSVDYGTTGTYSFTITASDVYGLSSIEQAFTLSVSAVDSNEYTKIYVRPFLSLDNRQLYQDFINNESIFPQNLMYRYFDPNFGIQSDIKMYIEFGIQKLNLRDYFPALQQNFYRKNLYFGDVKIAIAKDNNGNELYEVVYVDIIDPIQGSAPVVYSIDNQKIYYPNSINNMKLSLESIILPDYTYISVNELNLPTFMTTAQSGSYAPPEYIKVVPLCYALPGQGSKIVDRINSSNYDFKLINFEIDRLIIENTLDSDSAKYLIFGRNTIVDQLPNDNILFGPDGVELDISSGTPLTRD